MRAGRRRRRLLRRGTEVVEAATAASTNHQRQPAGELHFLAAVDILARNEPLVSRSDWGLGEARKKKAGRYQQGRASRQSEAPGWKSSLAGKEDGGRDTHRTTSLTIFARRIEIFFTERKVEYSLDERSS